MYNQEMKRADDMDFFRDMMVLHLDALTILYRDLLKQYAKLSMDDDLFNETVSEMVVISNHLLVKLNGSGTRCEALIAEFEAFQPWFDNILIPKADVEEMKKIHLLFRLIIKAYDMLGLSNI